jgi:hypothetical protein
MPYSACNAAFFYTLLGGIPAARRQSGTISRCTPLVECDEIAQRDGKINFLRRVEGINMESLLQQAHDQYETEGIQATFREFQLVGQRLKPSPLFLGYLLEC